MKKAKYDQILSIFIVILWMIFPTISIGADKVVIVPLTREIPVEGSGDAGPQDVMSDKTFTNDTGKKVGIMPNNGSLTLTPGATPKGIPEGYHDGSGIVEGDSDLLPENIKKDVTLFGVTGELDIIDTSSGDATSSDILRYKRAWVDGVEIVGARGLFLGCSPGSSDWASNVCKYNCTSHFPLFTVDCEGFCNDIESAIETYFGDGALASKCNL